MVYTADCQVAMCCSVVYCLSYCISTSTELALFRLSINAAACCSGFILTLIATDRKSKHKRRTQLPAHMETSKHLSKNYSSQRVPGDLTMCQHVFPSSAVLLPSFRVINPACLMARIKFTLPKGDQSPDLSYSKTSLETLGCAPETFPTC